jgi:hypothetical protein
MEHSSVRREGWSFVASGLEVTTELSAAQSSPMLDVCLQPPFLIFNCGQLLEQRARNLLIR